MLMTSLATRIIAHHGKFGEQVYSIFVGREGILESPAWYALPDRVSMPSEQGQGVRQGPPRLVCCLEQWAS